MRGPGQGGAILWVIQTYMAWDTGPDTEGVVIWETYSNEPLQGFKTKYIISGKWMTGDSMFKF